MSKQKTLSKWLQGLCFILDALLLGYFIGANWLIIVTMNWYGSVRQLFVLFPCVLTILAFHALHEFRKVCIEIGNGNSFSLENQASFHKMAKLGAAAAGTFVLRIPVLALLAVTDPVMYIIAVVLLLLALCFVILAEALSRLIGNAYEMRMENELTI